jgi:hypothetical protein
MGDCRRSSVYRTCGTDDYWSNGDILIYNNMDTIQVEQIVEALEGISSILWWVALWLFISSFTK